MTATVLIDTLSLYHAVMRRFGSKIDYGRLISHIAQRYSVDACIAYVLDVKDSKAFVAMLRAKGVDEIVLGTEENYGIRLVVDAFDNHSEKVVIATANDAFWPLLTTLADECVVYSPELVDSYGDFETVLLDSSFIIE